MELHEILKIIADFFYSQKKSEINDSWNSTKYEKQNLPISANSRKNHMSEYAIEKISKKMTPF